MPSLLDTDNNQPNQTVDTPAPAPTTDNTPPPAVDNTPTANWRETLPEAYRNAGWVERHSDLDSFMQSMQNAQSMLGKKNGIPDFENDKPEVIAEFRKQLGVPETSDGYKFEVPEGGELGEQFNQFKDMLHKGNVPEDIAKGIYEFGMKEVQTAIETYANQKEAEVDNAFKEFSNNPRFQEISMNVKNLLNQVDPSGEVLTADDLGDLGAKAPKVAMLLDRIASKITSDDKVVGVNGKPSVGAGSREEQVHSIFEDFKAGRISQATADARREAVNKVFLSQLDSNRI